MTKTSAGNFFEDFRVGELIRHATPRTVTDGDVALYNGLYGPLFAVQSSDAFAQAIGYPHAPVDDLLVFHVVFGKTVPDISLNAVANLGYAACRVLAPVYPGDTLNAESEVIGLKENSSRKTGIVFVRSTGLKQDGTKVLEYVRWVMVHKRAEKAEAGADHVPRLPACHPLRFGSVLDVRQALTAYPQTRAFDPASRPAAAPQRSLAALSCAPVSPWGSPAARSRGLLPVTPRQACPVAPASSQLAAGRAPCQPPGEGLGRRPVASTIQRVHSKRDCDKIAFEIPILFGRCETVRHL